MKNSKKKTMRFYLTLAGIKVLIKVLQLCGRNATHVPGRKAINICPDFLDQIELYLKRPLHCVLQILAF